MKENYILDDSYYSLDIHHLSTQVNEIGITIIRVS